MPRATASESGPLPRIKVNSADCNHKEYKNKARKKEDETPERYDILQARKAGRI